MNKPQLGQPQSNHTESNAAQSRDTPGVVAPPPLIYLCALLLGGGLCWVWPIQFVPAAVALPAGVLLVLAAVVLFGSSVREFRQAGTPLPPYQPTTALVTTGPYRFSRNPIYFSFTLLQLGIGLGANCLWIIAMTLPAVVLIHYGVIRREERYLRARLGDDYTNYTKRVRRWL